MKHIAFLFIASLLFLNLTGCGDAKNDKETQEDNSTALSGEPVVTISKEQFKEGKMTLGSFSSQNIPTTIQVSGTIDVPPQNKAVISAFSGGYIKNTPLLIGDTVKKGQLLVTLESPEFIEMQQQYLEAAEQLNYLKSEYERQKTLFSEKISSEKSFLKAESNYKINLAVYNGLRKRLQMLHIDPKKVEAGILNSQVSIFAPMNGSITNIYISTGMHVSPADKIMEIVNTDHIHLELSVYEKDIMNIKKDQKIQFRIPEATKDIFEAKVHLVGTAIDTKTRTVKVHGHLTDQQGHNFSLGMFVEASIITDSDKLSAIPTDAIINKENNQYVFRLSSETEESYSFAIEKIIVGKNYNGYTEVVDKGGVKEGEQILIQGGYHLLEE
ncbi:efflux RND transporter periplasmic adaptor subunit [Arenibacter sp. 6A1]|uniref:efflux RND transporter periplasmic adaptor subunit n=1 Tax=Arenibacter sp. 6A1 TaxID=2720391 RepID=UPI001444D5EF|nr:efflux RND transporter periplasmic adaptor subunit [Arenibacter sp. 6A1]NKI25807.1 efflux RND transporter periplasmic adaptor subunit [Arenibacter sp. 6A1]